MPDNSREIAVEQIRAHLLAQGIHVQHDFDGMIFLANTPNAYELTRDELIDRWIKNHPNTGQ